LFKHIQDGRAYTQAGYQPYGRQQIINIAYALIFNTGIYVDGCKEWEKNDILDKTWDNFKVHFVMEKWLYRNQTHTSQASGFQITNHAQRGMQANMLAEQSEATTMLASASASDRGTVSTLISTNDALDMHFYWVKNRISQGHHRVYWEPGGKNLADFFTKHPSSVRHISMRSQYVHNTHAPMIRYTTAALKNTPRVC
jgi:hypothetical protein